MQQLQISAEHIADEHVIELDIAAAEGEVMDTMRERRNIYESRVLLTMLASNTST
jgi:hypothetical protein